MAYQLEIKELFFSYGKKEVLKNINISIKPGSFISIIGPNGSGKSTLLKIISTYLKPQKGNILLDSNKIQMYSRRDISKRISVVPQNTSLEFDFKVKDIVLMGRHPYIDRFKGESKDDMEVSGKAMRYTNTMKLSHRMFSELSGGEKQRVILAQALAQEPEILLLDEPVSHLDLQHQVEILDLIKRMSTQENLTIISVLHDLNMASAYSDYIIMLKDGSILHEGKPETILNRKNIAEVFNINVHINGNPVTGKPYIYTLSGVKRKKRNTKIHIICGGGSGQEIIRTLASEGFVITTGVLNIGDSDWTISKEYQLEIAEETPFAGISGNAHHKNVELALKANVIVLTQVYFSKGNLLNLEVLLDGKLSKKKIYIIEEEVSFKERDFTGGKATSIYERLKERENIRIFKKDKLIEILMKNGENIEN